MLLKVLGRDENAPDQIIGDYRYWFHSISRPASDGNDLRAVITMVGQPGNSWCRQAAAQLVNQFDEDDSRLIGVASGLQSKVALGDVFIATEIIYYGEKRLEIDGIHDRPQQLLPPRFAVACSSHAVQIPWAVFRGVSDFGDPHKSDDWQSAAALEVSLVALDFLDRTYHSPVR